MTDVGDEEEDGTGITERYVFRYPVPFLEHVRFNHFWTTYVLFGRDPQPGETWTFQNEPVTDRSPTGLRTFTYDRFRNLFVPTTRALRVRYGAFGFPQQNSVVVTYNPQIGLRMPSLVSVVYRQPAGSPARLYVGGGISSFSEVPVGAVPPPSPYSVDIIVEITRSTT